MATECCNLPWEVNPGGAKSATELLKLTVILIVKLPIFVVRAPGSCSNLRAPLPPQEAIALLPGNWQNVAGAVFSCTSQDVANLLVR